MTLALTTAFPPSVFALPTGGQVVAGNVSTAVNGAKMTLTQGSRAAIMHWQQFNIATNEAVRIRQGAGDAMLARVTGGSPSELLGRLQADGKLFLINPKGILVGGGAVIDTGAFLASTLDVTDADFLKGGALTFRGDAGAGIVNFGKITAREGNVLLFAHTVKNAGEIAAPKGTAGLAAGTEVYLSAPDDPAFTVKLNLPATAEQTGVENSGVIKAAQAELKAAGGSIYDLAVNQRGLVQADGVADGPDGRVVLTAAGGTVAVSGHVTARKADGSGGEILVGGDYRGGNPAVPNAARTAVAATAVLDASASAPVGDGGKVVVWADEATRFFGAIKATGGAKGGDGGMAEVSGKHSLAFAGTSDLSAPAGKQGTLLLDPDDITIDNSGATPGGLANNDWLDGEDPGPQALGAGVLAGLLYTNNVYMQATNTVTVNAPVTVAAGGKNDVQLTIAAPVITLNEGISLANASDGYLQFLGGVGATSMTSAAGATIAAPRRLDINSFPTVTLNGPVSTANFSSNMIGAKTSFSATHASNAIANFTLVTDSADPHAVGYSGNIAVNSGSAMAVSALISAANNVTLSAGGNLTLSATDVWGGNLLTQITASGTTKLAATGGGVFINQAGAGALAGTGRRLIYTSNTDGAFTLGMAGYTEYNSVSYPADPQGATTLALYNASAAPLPPTPMLTVTADSFTKTYGAADPTFTASYSGGTAADLTTPPSFRILQGAHRNVGTYTIVPYDAASSTHDLAYANGTLTINPAVLTFVATPVIRTYGAANPVFSGTVTGFVDGDTLASATIGTPTFTSTATAASGVGAYAVNGSGLTASNYTFAQAAGNAAALTIKHATLTYVANPVSRRYGDANPAFGGTVTGFVGGDTLANATTGTLAFTSPALAGSNVGNYAINGSGLTTKSANYVLAQGPGNGTALTINPATLTYVANPASRLYGDANPAFGGTVTGFLAGDTLANATTGTLAFTSPALAGSNVGSYAINGSGLTANFGNYVLVQAPGNATALTVSKAPLSLVARSPVIPYGEAAQFVGLYDAVGLRAGDTAAVVSGAQVSVPAIQKSTPPGAYPIVFTSDGTAANYTITTTPGQVTVGPRPVTVTADDVSTVVGAVPKTFRATANAPLGYGPQYIVGAVLANTDRNLSAGTYSLIPVIYPVGTTPEELQRYYQFNLVPGTLTVKPDQLLLSTVMISPQPNVPSNNQDSTLVYSDLNYQKTDTDAANQKFQEDLKKKQDDMVVRYSKTGNAPLQGLAIGSAVNDLGNSLIDTVKSMLQNQGTDLKDMPADQIALLEQLRDGKLSLADFAKMVQNDATARAAIMPALGKSLMDAVASGKPLTTAEQDVLARISNRINEQRTLLAKELEKQLFEFRMEAAEAGHNNAFALKTMPDIAISAQQAATEQLIGAAIGAGVGVGVGAAMVAVLNISAVATAILPATVGGSAAVAAGTAFTPAMAAAGASAGVFAVPVVLIVICVVSGVMVAQEGDNIKAYNAAMDRAKTPVDTKLSNFDVKNDIMKAEFMAGFMATMLEAN